MKRVIISADYAVHGCTCSYFDVKLAFMYSYIVSAF